MGVALSCRRSGVWSFGVLLGHNLMVTELGGRATSHQEAEKRQREEMEWYNLHKHALRNPLLAAMSPPEVPVSWGSSSPAARQEPNTGACVDASRWSCTMRVSPSPYYRF